MPYFMPVLVDEQSGKMYDQNYDVEQVSGKIYFTGICYRHPLICWKYCSGPFIKIVRAIY